MLIWCDGNHVDLVRWQSPPTRGYHKRVLSNYKKKKAQYLQRYEEQKGKMSLLEIKKFLSVKASFVSHIKHANSYNLNQKIGAIDETNPFDYDRA